MNLKDAMKSDVRTFMNQNEFAEFHEFGSRGHERAISMIVQDDIENGSPLPYAEGVSLYRKICHVDPDELGYIPEEGMQVILDGKHHMVTSVEDARGILKIILEANV